jgi:hypothetical protein
MITQVSHNLFVGDMEGCIQKDAAIVHACKSPCYERIMGRNIPKNDPNYLFIEVGDNLYLNIIDPDEPLFKRLSFDVALLFIETHIENKKVIIHCNEGLSRSPSIAMLYLFKDLPYREAKNRFLDLYNEFDPNLGIDEYLGSNWWNWYRNNL